MITKELLSHHDLSAKMTEEARRIPGCGAAIQIVVVGPVTRPYTNWDFGINPANVSENCRVELNKIAGRLQLKYDLK